MAAATSPADRIDAAQAGRALAGVRAGVGAVMVLLPRAVRRWTRARELGDDAATALRVAGGCDLALGMGALLAARRRPAALRGWLEAGALADGVHVAAITVDRSLRRGARAAAALSAAGGLAAGVWLAQRITRD